MRNSINSLRKDPVSRRESSRLASSNASSRSRATSNMGARGDRRSSRDSMSSRRSNRSSSRNSRDSRESRVLRVPRDSMSSRRDNTPLTDNTLNRKNSNEVNRDFRGFNFNESAIPISPVPRFNSSSNPSLSQPMPAFNGIPSYSLGKDSAKWNFNNKYKILLISALFVILIFFAWNKISNSSKSNYMGADINMNDTIFLNKDGKIDSNANKGFQESSLLDNKTTFAPDYSIKKGNILSYAFTNARLSLAGLLANAISGYSYKVISNDWIVSKLYISTKLRNNRKKIRTPIFYIKFIDSSGKTMYKTKIIGNFKIAPKETITSNIQVNDAPRDFKKLFIIIK